jgi:hypothetical protein
VVPDTAARAALTAQIEEAIRKTCAEWDEKNAGGRMLNMDEVRDLMMMRTAEANHGAAVISSKGCVNAMSVPLPPKCDSLHPPDLTEFKDSHEIYALKVKQRRDTTGENLIVSPILACMSQKILFALRFAQPERVSVADLTNEMAELFIDKLIGERAPTDLSVPELRRRSKSWPWNPKMGYCEKTTHLFYYVMEDERKHRMQEFMKTKAHMKLRCQLMIAVIQKHEPKLAQMIEEEVFGSAEGEQALKDMQELMLIFLKVARYGERWLSAPEEPKYSAAVAGEKRKKSFEEEEEKEEKEEKKVY